MASPHNRSIARSWSRTIVGFVLAFAVLSSVATGLVLDYGARRGTWEWFRHSHQHGAAAYTRQLVEWLGDHAVGNRNYPPVIEALQRGDDETLAALFAAHPRWNDLFDVWFVQEADGSVRTSHPPCAEAAATMGDRLSGFLLCGNELLLVASSRAEDGTPALVLGQRLGDAFVDGMQLASNAEVALVGPGGYLGSTVRDPAGERIHPRLPPDALAGRRTEPTDFRTIWLDRGTYGGYRLGTEPLADGRNAPVPVYAFAGGVDQTDPSLPVDLIFLVPHALMNQGTWASLIVIGGSSLLLLLLVWPASRRVVAVVSRPLTGLTEAVRQVAEGQRSVQVPVSGPREIQVLGRAFNRMVEQLDHSTNRALQAEKMALAAHLAGAVAHEVNNPLAWVRSNLELLRGPMERLAPLHRASSAAVTLLEKQGTEEARTAARALADAAGDRLELEDAGELAALSEEVFEGIQRIALLVERFQQIAGEGTPAAREAVELRGVVESCAAHTPCVVLVQGEGSAHAAPYDVGTLVSHLLGFFAAHRRETDAVPEALAVAIRREGGVVLVDFVDPAVELDEPLRRRIFDPQLQVETSRGRTMRLDFGLAIAYQLALRNGGSLQALAEPSGGTRFRLTLEAI